MQRSLILMVKEPHPGRVKTRLGREIGMVPAAWWFRHQVMDLLRRVKDPRWHIYLAVSPDAEGLRSRVWPHRIPRISQGRGDLGQRMVTALQSVPKGPACVIGADIPGIDRQKIWQAFGALGSQDAVFGPAPDGGYWLTGFKNCTRLPHGCLQNVRWSTEYALADSIISFNAVTCDALGLIKRTTPTYALIQELQDVDTLADLNALGLKRPDREIANKT